MVRPWMIVPDCGSRPLVLLIAMFAGVGVLSSPSARAGDETYTYDVHGRLIKRQTTNAVGDVVTLSSSYDSASNRTSLVTQTVDVITPTVPTGLTGTVISVNRIDLSWSASTDGGGSALAGYRIRRNGAVLISLPTTPRSYSDTSVVGSTTYTYTVSAYDGQGNESAQSSAVTKSTPDITPPSVPQGLVATPVAPTWVNLSWAASTDTGGSGLAGYDVYRGGSLLASSPTNSYADHTVTANTAYSYFVKAYDGAGNRSGQSSTAPVTTPNAPDTTPPTTPAGLTVSAPNSNTVNLSWGASSDPGPGAAGVAGYQVYRGGSYLATTSGTSLSDTSVVCGGSYSYQVRAYDAAATTNYSGFTNPPVGITTPDTLAPSTPSGLSLTSAGTNQVTLNWSASSDVCSAVAGYRIYRGGTLYATVSGPPYTDTATPANQAFSYQVQAWDSSPAQNASGLSSPLGVTVPDTLAPSAPGTPTFDNIIGQRVIAHWTAATDNVAVTAYQYSVNSGAWVDVGAAQCSSGASCTIGGLTRSTTYNVQVRARDGAGNWGPASSANVTTSDYYSDTLTMVPGTSGDGWSQPYQNGYAYPVLGALSPTSLYGGTTVGAYTTGYMLYFDGANWTEVDSTTIVISGFSTNPSATWLNGGGGATFGCSNGTCRWDWPVYQGPFSNPQTIVLQHQ